MSEPINCRQCGNPLTEKDVQYGAVLCDRCWRVLSDYDHINDYDEFDEEEDEIYLCEYCNGEYSYDGGWSTCDCSERWGSVDDDTAVSNEK